MPLVRSATFAQSDATYAALAAGRTREVAIYSRYSNPTIEIVEERLAALEGAEQALVFSSGMAALHAAILASVPPGGTLVVADRLYGGTIDLLHGGVELLGLQVRTVDVSDRAALKRAIQGASLVLCESISNPTLDVTDLPTVGEIAREHGAQLLVDATFASPICQRALELGADLVMHSATKFLGGHSDLTAGVIAGSAPALEPIWAWRKRAGGCLDPQAAWLLGRGLATLALRVRAQERGAQKLAEFLAGHRAVTRVLYPGLPSHPTHELAGRLLNGFGSMVSFELAGGDEAALRFVRRLELVIDAPSLGGVESLVSLPRFMSHAHISDAQRRAAGIGPGFVRFSVGIEDPDDLVNDLEQALDPSR
jgi:methionine-gamma-lyase